MYRDKRTVVSTFLYYSQVDFASFLVYKAKSELQLNYMCPIMQFMSSTGSCSGNTNSFYSQPKQNTTKCDKHGVKLCWLNAGDFGDSM